MKHKIIHIKPLKASILVSTISVVVAIIYWLFSFVLGIFLASINIPSLVQLEALLLISFFSFCSTFVSVFAYNFIAKNIGGFEFESIDSPAT